MAADGTPSYPMTVDSLRGPYQNVVSYTASDGDARVGVSWWLHPLWYTDSVDPHYVDAVLQSPRRPPFTWSLL